MGHAQVEEWASGASRGEKSVAAPGATDLLEEALGRLGKAVDALSGRLQPVLDQYALNEPKDEARVVGPEPEPGSRLLGQVARLHGLAVLVERLERAANL